MKLHKTLSTLTIAVTCSLLLAVSTGCTPSVVTETQGIETQASEESTNTSQPDETAEDYSNTTN